MRTYDELEMMGHKGAAISFRAHKNYPLKIQKQLTETRIRKSVFPAEIRTGQINNVSKMSNSYADSRVPHERINLRMTRKMSLIISLKLSHFLLGFNCLSSIT
jgi:hypothetical protein